MTLFFKLFFLFLFVLQSLLLTGAILKDAFLDSQNSDLLYAPLFLLDLSESIGSLSDWNLTPSPYFFPDLLLFSPFYHLDIGIALFGYNLLFSSIWIILIWCVVQDFVVVCFLFLLVGFVFFQTGKLIYFFAPTHHSSLYLFGFYLLSILTTSSEKKDFSMDFQKGRIPFFRLAYSTKRGSSQPLPVGTQLGLMGVLFLYGMSDIQIFLQIFLPFLLFEIISGSWNLKRFRERFSFYFLLGFSVLLGNLFLNHLHHIKVLKVPQVPVLKTWIFLLKQGIIWKNLSISLGGFLQEAKDFYFFYLFVFLGYGFLVLVRQSFQFLVPHAKSLWITFFLSVLLLFLFQGSFGLWMGYRYSWFTYLFPLFFLGWESSLFVKEVLLKKKRENSETLFMDPKLVLWGLVVLCLWIVSIEVYTLAPDLSKIGSFYISHSTFFPAKSFKSLKPKSLYFRPDFIQCLTKLQKVHSLSFGVSDYWMNKYILYFSQNQLRTHPISSDLKTYSWINNSSLQDERGEFSFLIPHNLPKSLLLKRLGSPDQIEICESKEIWIYKSKFSYSQLHAEQRERKP